MARTFDVKGASEEDSIKFDMLFESAYKERLHLWKGASRTTFMEGKRYDSIFVVQGEVKDSRIFQYNCKLGNEYDLFTLVDGADEEDVLSTLKTKWEEMKKTKWTEIKR